MTAPCTNCRREPRYGHGLCRNCYDYERRTGKPRPKRLYNPGSVPDWTPQSERCECGRPAVRRVAVVGVKGQQVWYYDLCASCWREEQETRRRVRAA
jgi:hypothetical protein